MAANDRVRIENQTAAVSIATGDHHCHIFVLQNDLVDIFILSTLEYRNRLDRAEHLNTITYGIFFALLRELVQFRHTFLIARFEGLRRLVQILK
jgi:hypothetical protein